MHFVIIADDLTGANDSASQFARSGLTTAVAIATCNLDKITGTDVLIFDTESRDLPEHEARLRISQISALLSSQSTSPVIYKKVDSTLRGNIGAELEELITSINPAATLFAPAFPENGRTTEEGRQFLHGVPLEHTELSKIPKSPITTSDIKTILSTNTALDPVLIDLALVKKGHQAVRNFVTYERSMGKSLFICDATEPYDLDTAVGAFEDKNVLFAGSAGLARAVAERFQAKAHHPVPPLPLNDCNSPVLFLCGSVSEKSQEQCRHLTKHTPCVLIRPDLKLTLTDPERAAEDVAKKVKALPYGTSVLVTTAINEDDVSFTKQTSESLKITFFEAGERCARMLSYVMAMCGKPFKAFVMTGGDTAVHACNAVGATSFCVQGEIETGVAFSVITSGAFEGRPLITKAGAFGNKETFTHIFDQLTNLVNFRKHNMKKPILGITMGDVAGVGAEITVKSLVKPDLYQTCTPVVFGDAGQIKRTINLLGLNDKVRVHTITHPSQAKPDHTCIEVIDLNNVPLDVPYGKVNAACGKAAFEFIAKAVEYTKDFSIHAIVTAPLNKESLHLGGCPYPGHTEILAALTGTSDYSMMLVSPKLKVIHVSTHISLRKACDAATHERVLKVIHLAHDTLKLMDYANPRIAVAGLNPHSGEGGLFGDEELKEIIPAIKDAQKEGLNVVGPVPPDTVFHRAANNGEFDIVVVMYHDQGHIPLKVLGFSTGVNVTVGLPCIRTSVDHGTAFDIAGKGIADCESMDEALSLAATMANIRFKDKLN